MSTSTQTVLAAPVSNKAISGEASHPLTTIISQHEHNSQHDNAESDSVSGVPSHKPSSKLQKTAVTFQLSGINFANSCVNGLVVVGLPVMTIDLNLPQSLAFWPSSVAALTTTATILIAGSLADVLGPRSVDLVGCFVLGVFMLGCGFVQTGEQLVALRALQGIGLALHLASSVSLITKTLPKGRGRNVAFACLGISSVLGFSFGLVMGGVLVDKVGWRAGWYLYGSLVLFLTAVGAFSLPRSPVLGTFKETLAEIRERVDWVGALLASSFMALLSYFLAVISSDVEHIRKSDTIVFLCLGVISLPLFLGWSHRQVKSGKPALIPNSFWRNMAFSSICAAVAIAFAIINSLELFASLFFQEIQGLSALQAAIRILPSLVVGFFINLSTGLFIHKVPAMWIVSISSLLTAIAPILMAVIKPETPYWANAFLAQIFMPIAADALFTVGLIVITDVFPEDKQAVAGAVFNTSSQFGHAFGMAIMQVISSLVAKDHKGMKPVEALMEGYRASFWAMFAFMVTCAAIGFFGLRKAGKVGVKED
ncbi:major facilitator superfamily domain-containing protein [Emericellopsis atlantica]|uniref:Major facilitator superfamily domain-containing protein n=1 Tax=Emericellopsis atlantica TaxID=2614577 RepID=A0A9P8CRK6_9HYPO|nr:major facilitator superfamily domain-containing protein [Emericellopsis atlantica]KAG9256858.1 major facilitator superfamily domain-containing protein [Emericellopsis atlantica]